MTSKIKPFSITLLLPIVSLLSLASFVCASDEKDTKQIKPLEIGQAMPEFELKGFDGKPWKSNELKAKTVVVVFVGVECPLVKLYAPRLSSLQSELSAKFQVVAINSNRQDSITEMKEFAAKHNVDFPILKDPASRVADKFGAQRTPQVFLFGPDRKLVYTGAIDDQYTYGRQKNKVEKQFLKDAVLATIDDKAPAVATTKPDGCIIGRVLKASESSKVTYANQISRIFNSHCVSCHRAGEVAPFAMTDYEEVVGWAEMINEVVAERRMPPWHANPKHGKFKNDISLSSKQRELIRTWVENGAPLGDKKDLPDPPEFVEGWGIGKPDLIVPMAKKPYKVAATGVLEYEHFLVDPGFKEDKWITAAECRIGNRAVVHHIIVAADGRRRKRSKHESIQSEWITATAPGAPPMILPEGYAKFVPAGSKLVFQLHYTPNGTPQTDLSSVGFKFADPKTIRKIVATHEIRTRRFAIPPGAPNHEVKKSMTVPKDVLVLSLFPHMHVRGKSFRYTATYPDGKKEILLDVPNYDFNWQNAYELPEPKLIKKGTKIECVAHYDNSKENFANPNPNKTVRWGDQTFEEMMIGYVNVALADQDLTRDRQKK